MKQNKYDDQAFFDKYSQMKRSQQGLSGAGEWPTLQKLLPDFSNKRVLDLGCGYGWHCQYAIDHGAHLVTGVDISAKMLDVAKSKTSPKIEYINQALENLSFPDNSFDIVLSSLAFHYIRDFDEIVKNICRWLKPNGNFIFSVEHPIFTSRGNQDWFYDEDKNILHFPVDNYFYDGKREAIFLGEKVTKYHRSLTSYVQALVQGGFKITSIVEPQPTEEMIAEDERMRDELRRPMMLIVDAKKAD